MPPTQVSSQFPTFRLTVAAQMAEYRQRIAEQIRKEREKRGWRREDLAQKTGASYRQIERWETGKSRPQAGNLKKLAEVFQVDVTVLRPDLEAEEEELRQYVIRIEQRLDAIEAHLATIQVETGTRYGELLESIRQLLQPAAEQAKRSR